MCHRAIRRSFHVGHHVHIVDTTIVTMLGKQPKVFDTGRAPYLKDSCVHCSMVAGSLKIGLARRCFGSG